MDNEKALQVLQTKYHIEGPIEVVAEELEARVAAVEALKTRIPMKTVKHNYDMASCGRCGMVIRKKNRLSCSYYCHRCGQAIDWER